MITRTAAWKNALADAVRDPEELLNLLALPSRLIEAARDAARSFPLRVPRGFIARMEPGNIDDPLLKQVLPLKEEFDVAPGYVADPVGDLHASPVPGLLHKYHGRVLLIATGACAINCRYCFRRHYPYGDALSEKNDWQPALEYIAADDTITEVILSGGDPLLLDDTSLARLAERIAAIPHVSRLRIHTRVPVVLPQRVDDNLLQWLGNSRLQRIVVIHANHPAEIDATVAQAMSRLRGIGVSLLNQAVLLRGVNDEVDTLCSLSERLNAVGVLPYYLHLLDRVAGGAHFEVPEPVALELVQQMRLRLPGYLLPRLARELEGLPYKLQPSL